MVFKFLFYEGNCSSEVLISRLRRIKGFKAKKAKRVRRQLATTMCLPMLTNEFVFYGGLTEVGVLRQ